MDFKAPKHNTPAATLLKNYQDKKSGKVTESRHEIQHRFDGMEWKHQKKILLAFIHASATDRNWASRKMFAFWDNSFIPVVQTLWEQYHENPLSWVVIRYFPKDYLKQNMDSLSEGRNYYYLCQRLIDEEDFVIDKARLSESDMIKLFKISKKPVSDEVLLGVFFSMIAKVCKGEYQSSKMYKWDIDYSGSSELSILSNRVVRHTLFDIEYYLDRESLADQIRSWNSEVMAEVRDGDEYRMIAQMRSNEPGFQQEYLSLMKKYYLRHLNLSGIETTDAPHESLPCPINGPGNDTTAPNAILQEMRSQNPVVETLLKSFALELSEAVPF